MRDRCNLVDLYRPMVPASMPAPLRPFEFPERDEGNSGRFRTSIDYSIEKLKAERLDLECKITNVKRYLLELKTIRKNRTDLYKGL